MLPGRLSDVGVLMPAIEEIRAEAWPDVRDAEELHAMHYNANCPAGDQRCR